jgi:hypothetical protein
MLRLQAYAGGGGEDHPQRILHLSFWGHHQRFIVVGTESAAAVPASLSSPVKDQFSARDIGLAICGLIKHSVLYRLSLRIIQKICRAVLDLS